MILRYWINLEFPIPFLRVKTQTGGIGHYTCRLTYLPCDEQCEIRGEILLMWAVTDLEHYKNSSSSFTDQHSHRYSCLHKPSPTCSVEITEHSQERQDPRSPHPISSSTDLYPAEEETPSEAVPSSPFAAFTS